MNAIQNDEGKWVVAVGAPGSIARARARWPRLIQRINADFETHQGTRPDYAIEAIRDAGVSRADENETSAILAASRYGERGDTTAAIAIRQAPLYRTWQPEPAQEAAK